jgi:hypothetical protein
MILGVNAHPLWTTDANPPSKWFGPWLDAAKAGGATAIRFDVGWKSYINTSLFDLLALLKSRQMTPVAMLGDSGPAWAAPDPWAYATVAGKVAAMMGDAGGYLEIWNEPNLAKFWPGPDPLAYAHLAFAASIVVTRTNPKVKVMAGSVVFNDQAYLSAFLGASPTPPFDVLSIHPYTSAALSPDQTASASNSFALMVQHVASLGIPWAISELGWPTAVVSGTTTTMAAAAIDGNSASFYRAAKQMAQARGAVMFCPYHLGDRAESGAGEDYALLNQDLTPRLSWQACIS